MISESILKKIYGCILNENLVGCRPLESRPNRPYDLRLRNSSLNHQQLSEIEKPIVLFEFKEMFIHHRITDSKCNAVTDFFEHCFDFEQNY